MALLTPQNTFFVRPMISAIPQNVFLITPLTSESTFLVELMALTVFQNTSSIISFVGSLKPISSQINCFGEFINN